MTLSEIALHFTQRRVSRCAELSSFLTYCDLVKFAKATPADTVIQSHIDWLREYLDSFRPKVNGA
jgi:hypothetical protein